MTYLNLIIRHVSYPVVVYSIDACDVYRLVAVNVVSVPCFFNIVFFTFTAVVLLLLLQSCIVIFKLIFNSYYFINANKDT